MAGDERPRIDAVRWDLRDLYRDTQDPRLKEDIEEARRKAVTLEARTRGRIERGEISAEELADALRAYEQILELGFRPAFYASLAFAADTQSVEAQALEQWSQEVWSEIRNVLVFFELELQRMPDPSFTTLVETDALTRHRHYLELARRHRPHTLSEPEEQLLNRKELTSRTAFVQLFDEIAGSLRFELSVDGETRILTDGEIMALLHRPEPQVRRRALDTFLETYRGHELVLGSIFNNILLDHRIETDLRRFPSMIAPRHLENDIEPDTVQAMIDTIDRHNGDIQDYLRLKGRRLGLARMSMSDVYAPIGSDPERIPFARARDLVLDSFASFSNRIGDLVREFFDEGWIDAEIRPGKRAGAFCASHSPAHHPYVLLSYAGTARDVSTLAHELGHGIHARLASRHPLLVFDAPLVLAETASVFAEMLLSERLLQSASSADNRARILCDALDEIYGTIFRQNALTRFELAVHDARRERRLSPQEIGDFWMDAQRKLFGDAVEIPDLYRLGWIYIPHFVHTPFYCYSYSFGHLLVLALFERYREEGRAFVPSYLALLEGGGSESPSRLLSRMGIDITRPEFWETGFRTIRRLIAALGDTFSDAGLALPTSSQSGAEGG